MGRRNSYDDSQVRFLEVGYCRWRIPELTRRFNEQFGTTKTRTAIKSALSNRKILSGRPTGLRNGEGIRLMTPEQIAWVTKAYKTLSKPLLTTAFNEEFSTSLTTDQLRSFLRNHHIYSGRSGRFFPGQPRVPNSGAKGPGPTSFKKGNVPGNLKPLGHERTDSDGYVWVKVSEPNPYTGAQTRYRQKNHLVFEAGTGRKLRPGHCLFFRDGRRSNCEYDNLVEISRLELAQLNKRGIGQVTDLQIRDSMRAIAELECLGFVRQREISQ